MQESNPSPNLQENKELAEDISREELFKDLLMHPAWTIVKQALEENIEYHREMCVQEEEPSKILKVQATVKALRFIPKLLEEVAIKGSEARRLWELINTEDETLIG